VFPRQKKRERKIALVHLWFIAMQRTYGPSSSPLDVDCSTRGYTMTIASRAVAAAFASLFLMGAAFAQTPAPAPAAPAAAAPAAKAGAKAKPEQSAASKECSAQADAKGLHGKERKKFRSECKHNADKPS
jgi:psiF repeat